MTEHAIKELDKILQMLFNQKLMCNLDIVLRLKDLKTYLENDGK